MSAELTIVICTYNRAKNLIRLLDNLDNQSYADFSVIVVDASHNKFSLQNRKRYKFNIKFINDVSPNLPKQRWYGADKCNTEFIGFLDDDILLETNYLEVIMQYFHSNINIHGLSGWFENVPHREKSYKFKLRYFFAGINTTNQGKISDGGYAIPLLKKPKNLTNVHFLSGGSMFYRSAIFKSNCYLPWLYELYELKQGRAEDLAVSGLLTNLGYRLYCIPHITYYHHDEDGGTPFAKSGFNKGIADSYSRLKIYKSISNNWGIPNWISFFRYFVVNFVLMNLKDLDYQRGLAVGLIRYFRSNKIKSEH
jgi:GT2 family glycosyltransferase